MESPSGEVEVTLSSVPIWRGRYPWVLKVRGLYAAGRGTRSLQEAMRDFAQSLRTGGAGIPAGELQHLADAWDE